LSLQTRRYGHVGYLRGSRMALQLREVRVWEVVGVVAETQSWWWKLLLELAILRVHA